MAEKALDVLDEVMGDKDASPSARVNAATNALERGYGKATSEVILRDKRQLTDLSDEELEEFARADGESTDAAGTGEEESSAAEPD